VSISQPSRFAVLRSVMPAGGEVQVRSAARRRDGERGSGWPWLAFGDAQRGEHVGTVVDASVVRPLGGLASPGLGWSRSMTIRCEGPHATPML